MMVKDGRTQPPPSQSRAQFRMGIHTIMGRQREGNIYTNIVAMLGIYFKYQLLVGFYLVRQESHKRVGEPDHVLSTTLSIT